MVDDVTYEKVDAAIVMRAVEVLRARLCVRGVAICLSGIDGSGKTTLAQALVETFEASGVRARHLHVYQWHLNIVLTPALLLYNRYVGRRVLVLDRGIYDNISVLAARGRCPKWFAFAAPGVVAMLYPKFDYCFYLFTTFPEIHLRRPDTCERRFAALSKIYDGVAQRLQCMRLQSDSGLFGAALRSIAG